MPGFFFLDSTVLQIASILLDPVPTSHPATRQTPRALFPTYHDLLEHEESAEDDLIDGDENADAAVERACALCGGGVMMSYGDGRCGNAESSQACLWIFFCVLCACTEASDQMVPLLALAGQCGRLAEHEAIHVCTLH